MIMLFALLSTVSASPNLNKAFVVRGPNSVAGGGQACSSLFTPEGGLDVVGFHKVADSGSLQELRQALLLNPKMVNSHSPDDGYTPLIRAARNGQLDKVRLLLANGADINLPETKSMFALAAHKAAFMGHLDVIKAILTEAPAAEVKKMLEVQGPKNGKTVLMDALWIQRPDTFPENMKVSSERLPQYIAMTRLLIEKSIELGVNLNLRDHEGLTAKDMVIKNQNQSAEYAGLAKLLPDLKRYPYLETKASLPTKKTNEYYPLAQALSGFPNKATSNEIFEGLSKIFDVSDYTKSLWTGSYKFVQDTVLDQMVNLLPQHRDVFFDPRIALSSKSFVEWYKKSLTEKPELKDKSAWQLRDLYADSLGYDYRYRAMYLAPEVAHSILKNGELSSLFRKPAENLSLTDTFLNQLVGLGVQNNVINHLSNKTSFSLFSSTSESDGFALGTAGGFNGNEFGKQSGGKLFLVKMKVPKISLINVSEVRFDGWYTQYRWKAQGTLKDIVTGEKREISYDRVYTEAESLFFEDFLLFGGKASEVVGVEEFTEGTATYYRDNGFGGIALPPGV